MRTPVNRTEYVLVTAAHNEEAVIERTLEAVISQRLLPRKWVIVSDGSTDNTDELVQKYAGRYEFIQLIRRAPRHTRDFASKVRALHMGFAELKVIPHEFVGNLDADVSFDPSYFEELLARFEIDPKLGLAGGTILEERNGEFQGRNGNRVNSVAGAVQLFRRACFESIGGILPLPYGGEDWCAEVMSRMNGWTVKAFPELKVLHHRPTGCGDGRLRYCYRQGLMDFTLGCHPGFVIVKCLLRVPVRPYLLRALARIAGFAWAYCSGERRHVSEEFVRFLRAEQRARLVPFSRKRSPGMAWAVRSIAPPVGGSTAHARGLTKENR